jgi:hypothetical protein
MDINQSRIELIEKYVNLIINDYSDTDIKSLLSDYIYDEKSKMSNVALIAEIDNCYPSLLEE